jgi:hypothetical protein
MEEEEIQDEIEMLESDIADLKETAEDLGTMPPKIKRDIRAKRSALNRVKNLRQD